MCWEPGQCRRPAVGSCAGWAGSGPYQQGRGVSTLSPTEPLLSGQDPHPTVSPLTDRGSHHPSQVGPTPPADTQACSGAPSRGCQTGMGRLGLTGPPRTWSSLLEESSAPRKLAFPRPALDWDPSRKHGSPVLSTLVLLTISSIGGLCRRGRPHPFCCSHTHRKPGAPPPQPAACLL